MTPKPERFDDWPISGESPPIEPKSFKRSARDHFFGRALSLGRGLRHDHEVITTIDEADHSIETDHEKAIVIGTIVAVAAGLAVAGLLAARKHTRVKSKK